MMKVSRPGKARQIQLVIAIASTFLVLELVVGFITGSLVLVADAFHILSDIIGYIVAYFAIRFAGQLPRRPELYTFGYKRAETLGAFFNGAFLCALGVSVLLQSIERFVDPPEVTQPVLIMAVGAAGILSNVLMLLILGGHSHAGGEGHGHSHIGSSPAAHSSSHSHAPSTVHDPATLYPPSGDRVHVSHAHARRETTKKRSRFMVDLNVLGVLIHILGDALNSVAVIASAGIYFATHFKYADPIAAVLVGLMIIGTAVPLTLRSGRKLLGAVPETIDFAGVKEDVERISGPNTVHELHIWSQGDLQNVEASMHIACDDISLGQLETLTENIRKCLHYWGIHQTTIQPEITVVSPLSGSSTVTTAVIAPGLGEATGQDDSMASARCRKQCASSCAPIISS